ncbi:hypothetical protein ACRQ5B_00545 [Pseudarthrobacter sp. L19]|uniref:hypothetical protein n=1 Tax=Pseudarthrobacter sp. L19 TaxID=3423951 RepID=UPI003D7A2067
MNALWITLALLIAGFAGWPVTALVFRLARTIDDKADAGQAADAVDGTNDSGVEGGADGGPGWSDDPSAGEATTSAGTPAVPAAATPETPAPETPAPAPVPAAAVGTRILRGGAIIGVLERLAVALAILAGQPVAIAYVVAIKGLGRFAELKETPVAAERFIIGTLTSMLWAAGVAALARILLQA